MASGTINRVPRDAAVDKPSLVLVSHTGAPLSRSTTFGFTLDPNREQHQTLLVHAGAARLAYNHHIGRVKANLGQRAAERSYGVAKTDLTPPLSWSKVSFINHMNAWKDGRAADASVSLDEDGNEVRGLAWRGEVSTDVFECASVNAARTRELVEVPQGRTGRQSGQVPPVQEPTQDRTGVPTPVEIQARADVARAGNRSTLPPVPEARRAPRPRAHRQARQDAWVRPVSRVRGQPPRPTTRRPT